MPKRGERREASQWFDPVVECSLSATDLFQSRTVRAQYRSYQEQVGVCPFVWKKCRTAPESNGPNGDRSRHPKMKGSNFAHLQSKTVPCTENFSKPQIQGPQPANPSRAEYPEAQVQGAQKAPSGSLRSGLRWKEVEALEEERRRQKAKTLAIRSARFGRLGGTSLA